MIKLPEIKRLHHLELETFLFRKSKYECIEFAFNIINDYDYVKDSLNNYKKHIKDWLLTENEVIGDWLYEQNTNLINEFEHIVDRYEENDQDFPSIHHLLNSLAYICISINGFSYRNIMYSVCSTAKVSNYQNNMLFYINEIGMILNPISDKISPDFDLNIQEDFQVSLDFIQEYRHSDLIIEENGMFYLKFYEFVKECSINELIETVFLNPIYNAHVIRIIRRMLANS